MSYRDLFDFIQNKQVPISRNDLKAKAISIAQVPDIKTIKSLMDTEEIRGLWISAQNSEHQFVKQCGTNVIVLARGMNKCWDRFVFVKEMMHIFDEDAAKVSDGAILEVLLTEFEGASILNPSKQMFSELTAFWRALGVLCPESLRLQFKQEREESKIDDYEIALRLRIPELYVPRLFSPAYGAWAKRMVD